MNTLIYYSFNILILSAIVLILGMIKPKWILMWMDKPGRIPVAMIAAVIFMIGMVMFGEGNKELRQDKVQQKSELTAPHPHRKCRHRQPKLRLNPKLCRKSVRKPTQPRLSL